MEEVYFLNLEGRVLDHRWRIASTLAVGSTSIIYIAEDLKSESKRAVIKVESQQNKRPLLPLDCLVLETMQRREARHFLNVLAWGRSDAEQFHYMVLPLAGDNLHHLRRSVHLERFSASTALRLGCQMIEALRELHQAGWLHRDIKPSNLVLGGEPNNCRQLFLLDFGFSRPYMDTINKIKPPRAFVGFHGTTRWASIATHLSKDTGRVDDLWPVFYILLEQLLGRLPWRNLQDKDQVLCYKRSFDVSQLLSSQLFANVPCLRLLYDHLNDMNFYSCPDYDGITRVFEYNLHRIGVTDHKEPFDWEVQDSLKFYPEPTSSRSDDGVYQEATSQPVITSEP